jgi:hypothetical protein
MQSVTQLPCPLRTASKRDTSLSRAQREAIPQQGLGHLLVSQHKMQVAHRRTLKKRHIFKGFSAR